MIRINCEAEECIQHDMGKGKCKLDIEDISILEDGECSEYRIEIL